MKPVALRLTARQRLESFGKVSRIQSDEETYGLHCSDLDRGSGGAAGDGAGGVAVAVVADAARPRRVAMTHHEWRAAISAVREAVLEEAAEIADTFASVEGIAQAVASCLRARKEKR